ncbi:hypothetical protein RV14_GL002208 [Enterococcus ratti]|uniref:Uncharacterized protein n=1 Tax=Enterococcus ratti TaxID=150033 RepID=A0A1L8WNM8_9ENTE|nr:hypothetical protein RV14_GL002208 [Enterococcus ratti]
MVVLLSTLSLFALFQKIINFSSTQGNFCYNGEEMKTCQEE